MLRGLGFSLGIIGGHWLLLLASIALIMLGSSILFTLYLSYRYLKTTPSYWQHGLLFLIPLLGGIAYATLDHEQRQQVAITQPISSYVAQGHLISPSTTTPHGHQAIIELTSGSLRGKRFLLHTQAPLQAGIKYQFNLRLLPLSKYKTALGFDYATYLNQQQLQGSAQLMQTAAELARDYTWRTQLARWRGALINYLQTTLATTPHRGLIIALVCGANNLITISERELLQKCGIVHIFTISGLHISLVSLSMMWLVTMLLCLIPNSQLPIRRLSLGAGLVAALAYSLLAGFGVSAARSFYQIAIFSYLSWQRRVLTNLDKLSITLAIILALDPLAISAPGFWFSFGQVALLFQLQSVNNRSWLSQQFALTLISLPLSLAFFGRFAWIAPLANLWVIPLIGSLLTPWLLFSSLLHWSFSLKLAALALDGIIIPLNWLAQLPSYTQLQPNQYSLLLFTLGLGLWIIPGRGLWRRGLGLWLMANLFFLQPPPPPNYQHSRIVALLTPKAGMAVVMTNQHNLLVVSGANESSMLQLIKLNLEPLLQRYHILKLDLILSQLPQTKLNQLGLNLSTSLTTSDSSWQWDGVSFNSYASQYGLALVSSDHDGTNYLNLGYELAHKLVLNNALIIYPSTQLNWLYHQPSTNLITNLSQAPVILTKIENSLFLPATNLIHLDNGQLLEINGTQLTYLN